MKLEDLVNIEPFIESMTPPDRSVFRIWASTATEISRDRYKAIARIRDDYNPRHQGRERFISGGGSPSADVAVIGSVHRPNLEVVAVASGVASEFPFPTFLRGH